MSLVQLLLHRRRLRGWCNFLHHPRSKKDIKHDLTVNELITVPSWEAGMTHMGQPHI